MSAPTIDELSLADEPAAWEALGFAIEGDICRMGGVGIRFTGADSGSGIVGWSLREVSATELDGLPTTLSEQPIPEPAQTHPNGVIAIDHVVAMSPSLERSVAAFQAAGMDLRRIREEPTPAGAPRQAFFRLGREILELVQEPEEVVERAGGVARPARFWGLALLSEDLERTVAALGEGASEIRPAVQPGRRIATVRRAAGLRVPLALMSPDERVEVER
jgi:hypothetical protein